MNLRINSHHVELTPGLKTHVEDKVVRIKKHFEQVIDITAMLIVDKAKEKNLRQTAEFTLHIKGKDLYAEAHHEDLYHAIDAAVDKLDKQILKHKERVKAHHHEAPRNSASIMGT
jgi:putative sigma-54 modulation protein